jgi:hypothetical protein
MISATQHFIIDTIIDHFEIIHERPCRHTLKVMTEVTGVLHGESVLEEVRYMLDGKATGGGFRYDHPKAYREFEGEFWRQWNEWKGVQ